MRTSVHDNTRKITALTLVAALGVAVYLNWEYARTDTALAQSTVSFSAQTEEPQALETAAEILSDPLQTEQEALEAADKTYGEAQLVSVSKNSSREFFEQARLTRQKSYDDAMDKIQKALKNASLSTEEKAALTEEMKQYLQNLTLENEVETLVKAKGMAECVCFLRQGAADLTVMTEGGGLESAQVAQIRDIVLSKCSGLTAQDITVVEVK